MPEIPGRLLADMHPNGTVRIVFIAHTGGGKECPVTAKSLDTAEMDFVRVCGLTPERESGLRMELDRNKVVSVETCIDAAVAAMFRYAKLSRFGLRTQHDERASVELELGICRTEELASVRRRIISAFES